MSGFNKVTSFVLGLIVVLVFLFVFGSRVNLSDKLLAFRDTKVTLTPKVLTVTPRPTAKKKGFFESLFGRKITPTPSAGSGQAPTPKVVRIEESNVKGETVGATTTSTTTMTSKPQTIPQTGSPTILLPILIAALGGGIYLRKKN